MNDKRLFYCVNMKSKSEVPKALKIFEKYTSAPDAILYDSLKEHKSKKMKKICSKNGTSICLLEENTPWSNRSEVHVGLMKKSVQKDMK